ncbi:mucin-4-like [Diorhabda sublineata]|uniref:mucin-4-like n=1 Tax=Diorhabda sublineata TaxID=1163346 RepID=UPI0024E10491|nr:mucin-4-like [Diorhabda sublineata]
MSFINERRKINENFIKTTDKYSKYFQKFSYQIGKSCWKNGYSWMMWFLLFLCCFPVGLGLVHNRRVVQGAPWVGQDFHTYPHPGQVPIMARDVMVDVVNNLGMKLLAVHNENNEDNIAISPYGALSILVALGEGIQGEAVRELQKSAHIPNDISVIRIGLRDIHRHLKSYFIPPEGFLAGLTLNHENVTLKPEYEDILHFYGFDIMSFNNALYPNPPTTQKPIASTTDDGITKSTDATDQSTTSPTTLDSSTITTPISTTAELPMNDIIPNIPEITTTSIKSTTIEDILSNTDSSVLTTESISTTKNTLTSTKLTTNEGSTIINEPTTISTTEDITNSPTTAGITTTPTQIGEATTSTNPTISQPSTDTTEILFSETENPDKTTTKAPAADSTIPTTEIPITEIKYTESTGNTDVKTTESTVTTEVKYTESAVTTQSIVDEMPTTEVKYTESATEIATTESIVNETPTTGSVLTTDVETTESIVSEMPTTESASTTDVETTESIVSEMPTTGSASTTDVETTESIVSEMPTTESASTTDVETTESIVNEMPTTESASTTDVETTESIVSEMPTTESASITDVETTESIVSEMPTTESALTTDVETTESIVSEMPTTESASTTDVETTESIVSEMPTTESALTTNVETTESILIATVIITTESSETTDSQSTDLVVTDVIIRDAPTESLTSTKDTILESSSTEVPADSVRGPEVMTEINEAVKRNTRSKDMMIKLNSPNRKPDATKPLSLANNKSRRRRSKRAYNIKSNNRKSRSVVDYMIAKYYDSYRPLHTTHRVPYIPQTQPSFLVQGKYREYQVQFMKYDTWLPFFYVSHLKALALSFPLDSPRYYLLLLLPVQVNGVDQLIYELRLNGSFKYIIDNLRYRHVTAVIPSFLLKGYVNLTPTFQKLGIRKVFEPGQADFSPMTDFKGVYITNIEQAITVNIKHYMDPGIFGNNRQYRQEVPIEFRADHPFLYFVVDAELHVLLMAGKVVNPLNTRIT